MIGTKLTVKNTLIGTEKKYFFPSKPSFGVENLNCTKNNKTGFIDETSI